MWCFAIIFFLIRLSHTQSPLEFMNNILKDVTIDSREGRIPDFNAFHKRFDFIIVGAGSSGCVLANRLSEIKDWNILLLEAGGDETFVTDVPIMASFASSTVMDWGYNTAPVSNACLSLKNGVCKWPRGKIMGGCSVLNFLLYSRGNKQDYDDWAAMGNEGWSYDEVLPFFKKSERVGIKDLRNSSYHGRSGYMDVQYSKYKSPLLKAFLKAGAQMGYPNNDPNGKEQIGFSKVQATMRDGRRCSASKAFLEPVRDRKNLHVSKRSTVMKILIEPKTLRAYGVEFIKKGIRYRVRAKHEVILSAGTIGSAQLLMVSGVGPADNLQSVGVTPLVNLTVGDNLQDHISVSGTTFLIDKADVAVSEDVLLRPLSVLQYMAGEGPLTIPGGALGYAFVRTPYASLRDHSSTRPDMELVIGAGSLAGDTTGILREMIGVTPSWYEAMYGALGDRRQASFGINPVLLRPASRGYLRLRSADARVPPLLQPNYYQDPVDLYAMREGIKMAVQVGLSSPFRAFNASLFRKPYPGCEPHAFASDAYWDCALRQLSNTLDHQVGTCKMGPDSDPAAVVSPRLRVRGVRALRVADCSVMPFVPAGHTHAVATMIAEKAAHMIKQDWGLIK